MSVTEQLLQIVVAPVADIGGFHRRQMLEALSNNLQTRGSVVCIEPPVALPPKRVADIPRSLGAGFARDGQYPSNMSVYRPWYTWVNSALGRMRSAPSSQQAALRRAKLAMDRMRPDGARRVLWLYKPEQGALAQAIPHECLVYECYDEYRADPAGGWTFAQIQALETEMLQAADIVFVTSQVLYEDRKQRHPNVHLVPNGVPYEMFQSAKNQPPARDLATFGKPVVGYVGNCAAKLLDMELIDCLAGALPTYSFVFIGPFREGDVPNFLDTRPNVHFLGRRPYQSVPRYILGFDVAIIPMRLNDFTVPVDPLKAWEYLALGKPVVSVDLPSLRPYRELIKLARDDGHFIALVAEAAEENDEAVSATRMRAARERSWQMLTRQHLQAIDAYFSTPPSE